MVFLAAPSAANSANLPQMRAPEGKLFTRLSFGSPRGLRLWWYPVGVGGKRRRLQVLCKTRESQNGGVGRDLCGSSGPTLLLKQGHLQQAAQDRVQVGLEYLQ